MSTKLFPTTLSLTENSCFKHCLIDELHRSCEYLFVRMFVMAYVYCVSYEVLKCERPIVCEDVPTFRPEVFLN